MSRWLTCFKLERRTDVEQDWEVSVPALLVEAHQDLLAETVFPVMIEAIKSALALGHEYEIMNHTLVRHDNLTLCVVCALKVCKNFHGQGWPALETTDSVVQIKTQDALLLE